MKIGKLLKQKRLNAGLTQEQLAKRIGLKSSTHISRIENDANVQLATIEKLANALNCPLTDFINDNINKGILKNIVQDDYVDVANDLCDFDSYSIANVNILNKRSDNLYTMTLSKLDKDIIRLFLQLDDNSKKLVKKVILHELDKTQNNK